MMKKLTLFFLSLCLLSCSMQKTIQNRAVSVNGFQEYVDSLSQMYLVNSDVNREYLNKHSLRQSDMEKVKRLIIDASHVYAGRDTINDEMGTFIAKPLQTEEDKQHIKELRDTVGWSMVCNVCGIDGRESLTDKYSLNYYIFFNRLDVNDVHVVKKEAYIVDNVTKDSTAVEIKDLKCALISNPPLSLAFVFTIDHDGHRYIIHYLYDRRTWSEKRDGMPRKTTGCYQVK